MTDAERFGARFRRERRRKAHEDDRDWSLKDIAETLGTSLANVSRWDSGSNMPGDDLMKRIAAFFGVTPGWLRYGEGEREARPPRQATGVSKSTPVPRPSGLDAVSKKKPA